MRRSLVLLAFLCLCVCALAQRRLIYANIMFNYGNRAPPAQVYPNDAWTESAWPRGYAHLTNRGMEEAYVLGQFIKARYINNTALLPSQYTVDTIDVLSSSHDRCLQTAAVFLAALYPPAGNQIFQPNLPWQPIPVHTSDEASPNPMTQPDDIQCPNFSQLLTKDANITVNANLQYATFFRFLENKTGMPKISLANISNLIYIDNEITQNLTQPSWVSQWRPEINMTSLDGIHKLTRLYQDLRYNTLAKAKYGAGLMLGRWIANMQTIVNDSSSITKTSIYSVQEGSIQSMLSALGTGNHDLVPYAACLMLELYQDGTQFFVEAYYRNLTANSTVAPFKLPLSSCTTNCSLNDFTRNYQNLTFATNDQYLKACGTTNGATISPKTTPKPKKTRAASSEKDS